MSHQVQSIKKVVAEVMTFLLYFFFSKLNQGNFHFNPGIMYIVQLNTNPTAWLIINHTLL